jgi:hypothetical protein
MKTSVELHVEQLQAFASNVWLDDNNCPVVAVYIGKDNKAVSKIYPLSIDTNTIRLKIIEEASRVDAEYVFTIHPSKLYIDEEKRVLDSLNDTTVSLTGDAEEAECLVMVLNECKGTLRRIWAAITTDASIEFWQEYDYLTLTSKE